MFPGPLTMWVAERTIADAMRPAPWVVEYGAIDLPFGHPSRITTFSIHDTEDEADEAIESAGFNARKWQIKVPEAKG